MEINTRIVLRNDSTANWLLNNEQVLLKGEVGIEFFADGTAKMKIGDGVKTWQQLAYFGGDTLLGDNASIVVKNGIIKINGFDEAAVGSQLVKGSDGALTWVIPDSTTIDGLTTIVATLKSDVANIQSELNVLKVATEGKANAEDVYTKAEIHNLIANVYNFKGTVLNYSDLPTENLVVGDVYNIVNADADNDINAGDNVVWTGKEWDRLGGTVDLSGYVTTENLNTVVNTISETYLTKQEAAKSARSVKYEIFNKPTTTIVDYREKEIRIMCPADTEWKLQNVGANGDAYKYYLGFKAYAPDDSVVSFKEDMAQVISDNTMHSFENNKFAGIDEYGRKYSVIWLAAAQYNADTNTWSYYGETSTESKYIGWYYSVEWYNADGKVVGSDTIRINLSNENCHSIIEPYYMNGVIKGISINDSLLEIVNNKVNIPVATAEIVGLVKSSEEENKVKVNADGTMEVNSINVSKLIQAEGETLILNGGSSAN